MPLTKVKNISTETAGTSNFVVRVNAGNSIASGGNYNVALGDEAGTAITTGDENVCIGYQAGDAITTGTQNVAIGANALSTEDENHYNVAIGREALQTLNGGDYNVAVGRTAGKNMTTGQSNVLVGGLAGDAITTGDHNVAIGKDALHANTQSNKAIAIGSSALYTQNITSDTDSENVAMGFNTGYAVTTGQYNTLIGGSAGDTITDGLRNTILGYNADCNASADDTIVIGATCVSASDGYITMGRGSGTERIYNLPTSNASWSHTSDERFKKDITTNTDCGLDFINELRTVTYKWKAPSELDKSFSSYDKDKTEPSYANKIYGLIAQEVKSAMDKHNITNFDGWGEVGDEKLQSISEAMFVFPLIKAVQELSAKVDALEVRIKKLEDA